MKLEAQIRSDDYANGSGERTWQPKTKTIQKLVNPGIIAVIRADSSAQLMNVAEALVAGGAPTMEVTMTTPNALQVISEVKEILAASGFLPSVVPGLSTGTFLGFSLLYALFVAIAPLVYQACYQKGKPTYWGLLLAGWVVLVGVMGEFATAVVLVNGGWLPVPALWAIFGVGMVALVFYVRSSVIPVIEPAVNRPVDATAAATSAAATAAAIVTARGGRPAIARTDAMAAARAAVVAANAVAGDALADQVSAAAADAAAKGVDAREPQQQVAAEAGDAARKAIRAATNKRAIDLMAETQLPCKVGFAAAAAATQAHAAGDPVEDVKAAALSAALAVIQAATAQAAATATGVKPTRVHPFGVRPAAMW